MMCTQIRRYPQQLRIPVSALWLSKHQCANRARLTRAIYPARNKVAYVEHLTNTMSPMCVFIPTMHTPILTNYRLLASLFCMTVATDPNTTTVGEYSRTHPRSILVAHRLVSQDARTRAEQIAANWSAGQRRRCKRQQFEHEREDNRLVDSLPLAVQHQTLTGWFTE